MCTHMDKKSIAVVLNARVFVREVDLANFLKCNDHFSVHIIIQEMRRMTQNETLLFESQKYPTYPLYNSQAQYCFFRSLANKSCAF